MPPTTIRFFSAPALSILVLLSATSVTYAAPIVYTGTLVPGVTAIDSLPGSPSNTFSNPLLADYWSFFATAGDNVTITGHRREAALDPAFWLFAGLFADTSAFGLAFDGGDPGFIAVRDDTIPPPPAFPGDSADPQFVGVLATTGFYTVAFVSNGSAPGGDVYDYDLVMSGATGAPTTPVPEPSSMLLLSTGIAGLFLIARRRNMQRFS